MHIKEIVLDGFKSYAKRTIVSGWDTQFNCITGLNGSGKSNILDAICFVLGITTLSTVRASNQKDLIYKRGQAGVTTASVCIVFDNTDPSNQPLGYEGVRFISVTRQVIMGGTTKYLINGHKTQQSQVQALFQSVHLNVNNPNFLIMQGQITKVVNMKPIEILGLIEEAAGTGMYEKERKRAVKEINDRDAPLQETELLLNEEVRPKLERLRAQKRDFLEFQQCASSTEELEKIVGCSTYLKEVGILNQLLEEANSNDAQVEELRAQIESKSQEIQDLEAKCSEIKEQQGPTSNTADLEAEIEQLNQELIKDNTELEMKQQQLNESKTKLIASQNAITQIEHDLVTHNTQVSAFESQHKKITDELEDKRKFIEKQREFLTGLKTGISSTGDKETGYAYATKLAREALTEAEQQHRNLNLEAQDSGTKIQELTASAPDLTKISQDHQSLVDREQTKRQELNSLETDIASASQQKTHLQELRDKETDVTRSLERLLSINPDLDTPRGEGVIGRIAHIIKLKPEHSDKATALEVCAGRALWNLVVENDKIGAAVLKGAQKRMTVLPLSRMKGRKLPPSLINQIDRDCAWSALDLFEFDAKFEPALAHVFGTTVICSTAKVAERAAFVFKVRAVTLEGDVFDPRGVISGGSNQRPNTNNNGETPFTAVSKFMDLNSQRHELALQKAQVSQKIDEANQVLRKSQQLTNELELINCELEIALKKLKDAEAHQEKKQQIEQRLHLLQTELIPQSQVQIEAAKASLVKCQKDADEFTSNRSGKLQEITQELETAIQEERQLQNVVEAQRKEHMTNQSELTRLQADLAQEKEDLTATEVGISELSNEISATETQISNFNETLNTKTNELQTIQTELANLNQELNDLESKLATNRSYLSNCKLTLQKINYTREKHVSKVREAENSIKLLTDKWPWCTTVTIADPKSGRELDELTKHLANEKKRIALLESRVDSSVVSMIGRLEEDEASLRHRLATIREDRRKLEESMEVLNEKRTSTISEVWQSVSDNFGQIFGDLLPGSSAELVPLGDPIKNGFNLHVRLGATWKDGLTELSGGQRSLVALALILALLKFHPAPVYILDEVDAALDVHHTRNIGHIIKTRFQKSQFVVVSLKDDMFTNANRIFQTKFVDGTSTVQRVQ